MNPIKLTVLHHSDSTCTLKDLDIEYSLEDCDRREVAFFNIAAISPFYEGEKEYCTIHSNSTQYVADHTYSEVLEIILNK